MVIPGLQFSDAFLRLLDPEARGGHFGLRTGAYAVELAKYPPLSTPTVGLAVTSGRADPSPSFPPPSSTDARLTGEHRGPQFPECNARRFSTTFPRLPLTLQPHLVGREVAPS